MDNLPESIAGEEKSKKVPWNGVMGVIYALVMFFVIQIVIGLALMLIPLAQGHNAKDSAAWLNSSISHQFLYVLIVETLTVLSVFVFMKMWKAKYELIGLRRIKLTDLMWGIFAYIGYFLVYILVVVLVGLVFPKLNINTKQDVGFKDPLGALSMTMTFIGLVVLPPIAEEILVRGFIYSSLRKFSPKLTAAILASLLFCAAHLPEGVGGLLWIGFIDTFVLSMVLIYVREKTGGIYAGMVSHFIKNSLAFVSLYVAGAALLFIR